MVKGFDDGSEESNEEGIVFIVGIGGGDNPVDPEEERIGLRNQRVEPFGNGATSD